LSPLFCHKQKTLALLSEGFRYIIVAVPPSNDTTRVLIVDLFLAPKSVLVN